VFGTCRCNNVADNTNLSTDINFTHSTKEVIQFIKFLKGELTIPSEYTKCCFRTALCENRTIDFCENFKERFLNTDAFIIEICSKKKYIYNGFFLHSLAVDTNHHWIKNTSQDVLNNFTVEKQSDEEIEDDILKIRELLSPKKIIIVSHFNAYLNRSHIPSRDHLVKLLENICRRHNIFFVNPLCVLSAYSQDEILKRDFEHYTEFALEYFTKWMNGFIDKIVFEQPHKFSKSALIITKDFDYKNRSGIELLLQRLNFKVSYYTENTNLVNYDLIYSPCHPIDASQFPKQKFIFGPHFSLFPDLNITQINARVHNNAIYILTSKWIYDTWKSLGVEQFISVKEFSFPVDTTKYTPNTSKNDEIIVYYKKRKPEELRLIITELNKRNIRFKIFNYSKGYKEEEFVSTLERAPYGIWIGAEETQGCAILDALSCDVPLLVWSVKDINQNIEANNPSVSATSVPYWDERCGEVFHEGKDFLDVFNVFVERVALGKYAPRAFVCDKMCIEESEKSWKMLFE